MERILAGKIDRIGLSGTYLTFSDASHAQQVSLDVEIPEHDTAANFLIDWLEQQVGLTTVCAIGHRVIHGMKHAEPACVSPALLDELRGISDYDPEHLPGEIELIEAFRRRYPQLPQVACFDTAFHHSLPPVARLLPIPRRFNAMGIQRYGFHGLSYAYLMQALAQVAGPQAAQGRVILAHLGNGASLAAVRDGQSIDTSMEFTPAGGLVMGNRSGDLVPGAAWYMMQSEQMTSREFNHLINHESDLLGISETSSDMRDLAPFRGRTAQTFSRPYYEAEKNWKFSQADMVERGLWEQYMQAYEACLSATSTKHAPWYVVPADDKKNARLIVSQIILDTFKPLKMHYPKTDARRQQELLSIRQQLMKENPSGK